MPQLIATVEGVEIKHVYLQKDRTTLGRSADNDVVLDNLVVSGHHCAFVKPMLVLAVIVLRRRRPEWPRPFRAPGYPGLPILYAAAGAVLIVILLAGNPGTTWPGYAIVASGVPVYFLWRARGLSG